MEVRKIASWILCLVLAVSLTACGSGPSQTTMQDIVAAESSTNESSTDTQEADAGTSNGDTEITIALMMKSLASEWNQNIEESLEKLGEERGFRVLTFDADGDSATQLLRFTGTYTVNII